MIFYIDADNRYKSRIDGIKFLSSKDTVIIYYNGNNLLFEKNSINDLKSRFECQCNIEVKRVDNSPQAVDFAIAIDVAKNDTDETIYIVGEDKHLDSITKVIDKPNVGTVISIRDCLVEKLCEIDDISEYVEVVQKFFPNEKASRFIRNQIKMSINLNKYANELYEEI